MKALIVDNKTDGAIPVDIQIKATEHDLRITIDRKHDLVLVLPRFEIEMLLIDTDDGK